MSGEVVDQAQQFLLAVALGAGKLHKLPSLRKHDAVAIDDQLELELLMREARRRQRRRYFATAVFVLLAAGAAYLMTRPAATTARPASLVSRPMHFPALGPGGRCPVSSGYLVNNPYFVGDAIGRGRVRLLLADQGDIVHGRVDFFSDVLQGAWFPLQTLWFAMPGYNGPFVIRAARLGKPGPIQNWPSDNGLGSGPLTVSAGATANSFPAPAQGPSWTGYRTVPGSTWVRSPGCYAWQVDGRGFSDVLVVDVVPGGR